MRTFSRVWVSGNSLVITIPKEWVDYLNLKESEVIEWELFATPKSLKI